MKDGGVSIKESESKNDNINIDSFIDKISKNLSIEKKIRIIGKILYYMNEEKENDNEIINFSFNIFKNTNINPFPKDILMNLELIPNKIPYARIRTDFTLPSLYDNRNYFYCLTNMHNYLFDPTKLEILENILQEITNEGIQNFLFCIKENLEINTFIYYGEYELQYIYNMNDFLENYKLLKLYRVNQILENGKDIEEKYIVITQLYILIFKPQEKDKSFAQLIFIKNLKNISFNYKKSFNKKLNSNSLILYIQDIKTPNGITYEFEFTLIDRSRPPVIKLVDDLEEEEEDDDYETKEKSGKNENEKNKIIVNENNSNKKNKSNNENKNEENDIWDKYYKFEEEIERKQKEINIKKYKLVVEYYRSLFNHRSNDDEKKLKGIELKNTIMEYEKMFQHCEKMYNYYESMKDKKNYKKRMEYYIVNINFFCAELMEFFDLEKANFKFYFDKMKYYLNLNENNQ